MDNYIRWNFINWVTVGIIAISSLLIYGFIGQTVLTAIGKAPSNA